MYLLIAEVSKKQDYIFSSLHLRDNIINSANIDRAVSDAYFSTIEGYTANNMVYSGGGHTVLQFDSKDAAVCFARGLTAKIRKDFMNMELFVKLMPYDDAKTPAQNINALCTLLEEKKSLRAQAFKSCSFGIDRITVADTQAKPAREDEDKYLGYSLAYDSSDLGGSEGDSNFVAVVHIDGNSMGKRVRAIMSRFGAGKWEDYKANYSAFCNTVDSDFKTAFDEMVKAVIQNITSGKLTALNLKQRDGKTILPIRKIILAGDDVCFVCDGRIGLECANIFLKHLMTKTNAIDGEPYYAAAGVCIVHSKFPFYRAYQISEGLCSSAKRFIAQNAATVEDEGKACAIDWHIDFGEPEDAISTLKLGYVAEDGSNMLLRPYYIGGEDTISYDSFREKIKDFQTDNIARGKIKELREAIKHGKNATVYFVRFNSIEDIKFKAIDKLIKKNNEDIHKLSDLAIEKGIGLYREDKCIVFDAIESMDTFIPLEEVQA